MKIDGGKEIVEDDQNVIDVIEVDDVSCLRKAEEACLFRAIKVE